MSYDALAESIALIEAGTCGPARRPSRRRRFVPFGVDVQGDIAVTCFVRRGINGQPGTDLWVLTRVRGEWRLLGGGLSDQDWTFLQDRPQELATGDVIVAEQASGFRYGGHRWIPFTSRDGGAALLQTTTPVAVVMVGKRRFEVPDHGYVVACWRGDSPRITALSAQGQHLQTL